MDGSRAHVGHQRAALGQVPDDSRQPSPRSNSNPLSMEDSSCFGSMSAYSSPREPKARIQPAELSMPQHSVAQHAAQSSVPQAVATAGMQAPATQQANQSGQSTAGKAQRQEHRRQPQATGVAAQHQLGVSSESSFTASAFGWGSLQSGSEDNRQADTHAACDECHERRDCTHDGHQPNADPSSSSLEGSESGSHGEAALSDPADGKADTMKDDSEMSESEEEFERMLADARQLRPTNQLQAHVRYDSQARFCHNHY